MICVDNTIIGAQQLSDINQEIMSLGIFDNSIQHTLSLIDEGEVSAFLGIQIKGLTSNKFQLTQPGLIDKILTTMHIENCNGCDNPAATSPMHVIGMMMYLANNTRTDIAYAVHQTARFTHHPCHSHVVGVKKIAQYLK
jgi:hypothetical protein